MVLWADLTDRPARFGVPVGRKFVVGDGIWAVLNGLGWIFWVERSKLLLNNHVFCSIIHRLKKSDLSLEGGVEVTIAEADLFVFDHVVAPTCRLDISATETHGR
jgi:hypothetical protein